MTGCVVNRPLQRKAGKCRDCSGEGIMRGSCKGGREKRSLKVAGEGTAAQIFLAKTFRGFTTTASGSKFSDDSWDKIENLTRS